MESRKSSLVLNEGMKNWALTRRFKDFCNDNSICTVVLVADNPFIVQYFKLLFSGCDCKFISAGSGDEAIRKLDANGGAEIVMVDNDLPNVNSAALRKVIKRTWPGLKVIDVKSPAIGRGRAKSVSSAGYRGMGPASYIEKPFDVNSIVKTITSTIGR